MNRYRNTFFRGGYNGGFALSLPIVPTNVVVLCEYLSQEFSLWGTIKVIVLYLQVHEYLQVHKYYRHMSTYRYTSTTGT